MGLEMKRFTETTKWDDPWFRKLSPKLKCLWQYICDRCDGAGVIDLDIELASFQIGTKISEDDMRELSGRVEHLACGKWWVVRFVPFQYGKLSAECKAHAPVIASLTAYGLTERVSKGYPKGINTLQEKEKDKEKDNSAPKTELFPPEPKPRKDRGTLEEIQDYCIELGLPETDGTWFFDKCEGCGWKNGGSAIKDWKATIRQWRLQHFLPSQKTQHGQRSSFANGNGKGIPGTAGTPFL